MSHLPRKVADAAARARHILEGPVTSPARPPWSDAKVRAHADQMTPAPHLRHLLEPHAYHRPTFNERQRDLQAKGTFRWDPHQIKV